MIDSCRDALYERLFLKILILKPGDAHIGRLYEKFIKFFTTIKPGDARIGRLYNLLNGCFNKLLYFNLLINGIHMSSRIRFFEDYDEEIW